MADDDQPDAGGPITPPVFVPPVSPDGTTAILPGVSGDSRAKRGSVTALAGTSYAGALLGLVTAPIVARALGPEGRGAYAVVISYSTLLMSIMALGLASTVIWAIGRRQLDAAQVLGACARYCVCIVPVAILAGAAIAFGVLRSTGTETQIGAFVFVAMSPLNIYQLCLVSVLLTAGHLGSLAKVRATPLALGTVGIVVLAAAGVLTIATYLALTFTGLLVTLWLAARLVGVPPRRGLSVRPLLSFGRKVYVGSLAYLGNGQLDQALIGPFLGLRDLGHYAVAVVIASVPLGLIQAIGARATSAMTDDKGELALVAVAGRFRLSVTVGALGAVALAATTPVLVPALFGAEFGPSAGLCLVLLLGTVAQAITAVANPIMLLANRPTTLSVAEFAGLAVTALGLAVTLPLIGVMGAAITSVLAYWVRAVIQFRVLRQLGVRDVRPRVSDLRLLLDRLPFARLLAKARGKPRP